MSILSLDSFDEKNPLFSNLSSLGLPNAKTEQYKHFSISAMLEREYYFLETKKQAEGVIHDGEKLRIENGTVCEVPFGVKVSFSDEQNVDKEHFDSLYFASHLLAQSVIHIDVRNNIKFEIEHIFNKVETFLSYRVVLHVEKNLVVEVYESFLLKESRESFFLYGYDVHIECDSTLVWIRNEKRLENEAKLIGSHKFSVEKRAVLQLKTFDYGSADSLHLYKIDLQNYAWLDASHLLLASKKARRGNVIQVNHNQAYAKSVQEARSILKDNATGIFDSKICVNQGAAYSNVAQNSKAILLGEKAHMYAKPQLEIYIDELEASHGSTIGTLDEEILFYLCSRGIKRERAKTMLVLAFANRLIETIENQEYRSKVHTNFEDLL